MNSFKITGKLHKKFETEQKTPTFSAREFVLEMNDNNYINYIKFQLTQDRCSLIDAMEEQEEITVSFDLRGREWQGKYFTNLNAWRVEKAAATESPVMDAHPLADASFPEVEPEYDLNQDTTPEEDDLPF